MPDLDTAAVLHWFGEREPELSGLLSTPFGPTEEQDEVRQALVRLGDVLDQARSRDAAALSVRLHAGPLRDGLATVLAQLGPARQLCLLDWCADGGIPEPRAVLAALLRDDEPGNGQALRASLLAFHRRVLLARLFSPKRIETLREACRTAGVA